MWSTYLTSASNMGNSDSGTIVEFSRSVYVWTIRSDRDFKAPA